LILKYILKCSLLQYREFIFRFLILWGSASILLFCVCLRTKTNDKTNNTTKGYSFFRYEGCSINNDTVLITFWFSFNWNKSHYYCKNNFFPTKCPKGLSPKSVELGPFLNTLKTSSFIKKSICWSFIYGD